MDRALAFAVSRTGSFFSRHPRGVTAAVVCGLTGFGVTAFGIAPLAPDAAELPRRLVTESVAAPALRTQLDALADHETLLYRSDLTRTGDTADSLLARLNIVDPQAAAFLRGDALGRRVLDGRGGKMVRAETEANGLLAELVVRYAASGALAATHFSRLRIHREAGGFVAEVDTVALAAQVKLGSGTVRSTLYAATDDARIPDAIATQLAEAFATDIDFHRELRKGDTFLVVYESMTADGEPITWSAGAGRLLAAEFTNGDETHSAVWFETGPGKGAYFNFDGKSKRHTFLASPMEFSRITSGFAMRMHPILNAWKQHKGVDYGAPEGTPVRAVGEGLVDFAGWQNGYGNVVELRHSEQRSTLYAHLSRIDVRRGEHVEQGKRIGTVGSTGWATGPHLHFEVKLQGVQQDPMALARTPGSVPLEFGARARFAQLATSLKSQLEVAEAADRSGRSTE